MRRPLGATLVEVIAATALAAVLLVALLAVSSSTARRSEQLAHAHVHHPWWFLLRESVRRDLLHTRRVELADGAVTLLTYETDEPVEPIHVPVKVTYRLHEAGEPKAIIREAASLCSLSRAKVRSELMLVGVSHFGLTPLTGSNGATTGEAARRWWLHVVLQEDPSGVFSEEIVINDR